MKKKETLYLTLLALSLVLLVLIQWSAPKPIDWQESYHRNDKIPFGGYIFYDLLDEYFPESEVKVLNQSVYEVLLGEVSQAEYQNLLFINNTFAPDQESARALMDYVALGQQVFISARQLSAELKDTLKLKIETPITFVFQDSTVQTSMEAAQSIFSVKDSSYFHLLDPELKKYVFEGIASSSYFTSYDTANTEVLGEVNYQYESYPNFIRIQYGDGAFLIHADPQAFANINMLEQHNADYLAGVLAYLEDYPVYWDAYYKAGRKQVNTPFRYMLSQNSLRYALMLGMFSLVLFILFEGKRKQRIMPVLEPLKNSTLEFVHTIAALYWESKLHKKIAHKKIAYLLNQVRTVFLLPIDAFNKEFLDQLAMKSGVSVQEVKKLFQLIEYIQNSPQVSKDQLIELNRAIESFNQKRKR